ncbi:taste receptor type 2 member 143-like [Ambystoma mexicanum]|uniref:taste receptor type 2 member 143-like n=1 Tax=Ambystoma mexicanum TaxID=8296 RepID=UPI0037E8ADE9
MTSQGTATALLAASGLLLCTSLLGNLFILEAVLLHRRPGSCRTLPTNELVISSLALVNVLSGVSNFLWLVVYLLELCQRAGEWVYKVLDFTCIMGGTGAFWFTACLSAFYSLKISSFSPPCVARLRLRAPSAMPFVLLFLLLACGALSGPTISYIHLKAANGSDLHCGDYYEMSGTFEAYYITFSILGYLLPLVTLTTCSALLVASLCHHYRRVWGGPAGPRTDVYLRVVKMVLGLLAFYAFCVVFAEVSDALYKDTGDASDWFVIYSFALLAYSAGCPIALTYGTARLHRRLRVLCVCVACCRSTPTRRHSSVSAGRPVTPKDTTRCSPGDGKSIFVMAVD